MNDIKLNYDDVAIVPEVMSTIKSRKECNPFDENGRLPIFCSPMDSVISEENYDEFVKNGINVVLPRTINISRRVQLVFDCNNFVAFSLAEAEELFVNNELERTYTDLDPNAWGLKICIDMANGHMTELLDIVKKIKNKYPLITIMTGNIANPKTYLEYEKAGVDYVRVGIGGGSPCLTSSNTGVHFPYFSLLDEIYRIKVENNCKCKIIADGNIRGYRDVQKALTRADYVMIGGLFNKAFESAGKTTYGKFYWNVRGYKIFRPIKTLLNYGKELDIANYSELKKRWKNGEFTVFKQYWGMASKKAQANIANGNGKKDVKFKTSEGKILFQKVEYTLESWVENETDYLRSAMSYTNSHNLDEYKNTECVQITNIRYNN